MRELIDARLLTSYEVREDEHDPIRRVEIIHESLLANWPRLVRWQTQDQEGAQLRDELRQSARAWDEHGRHDDRLWTGTAFREYQLWRERYPGGLTETEEAFANAMTALAGRRRQRRRMAAVVGVSLLIAILAVVTGLWRRSVLHERRGEAQKLIALGTISFEDYPSAALAHATASLDLVDSEEARLLALKVLWEGPTAFVVNDQPTASVSFSPGGSWLVQNRMLHSPFAIISSDGQQRIPDYPAVSGELTDHGSFGGLEDFFMSWGHGPNAGRIALWSAPEGRLLAETKPVDDPENYLDNLGGIGAHPEGSPRALFVMLQGDRVTVDALHHDGSHVRLGTLKLTIPASEGGGICVPRATGEWFGLVEGKRVSIVRIGGDGLSDRIPLGQHDEELFHWCDADPLGRFLVTVDRSGGIKLWDLVGDRPPESINGVTPFQYSKLSTNGSRYLATTRSSKGLARDVWIWNVDELSFNLLRRFSGIQRGSLATDGFGRYLAMAGPTPITRLWPLGAPASAEPILLRRGPTNQVHEPEFSPDGRWVATCDRSGLILWPLVYPKPTVLRFGDGIPVTAIEFGPGGTFLAIAAGNTVSVHPLDGPVPSPGHTVFEADHRVSELTLAANGELLAASVGGHVWLGGTEPGERQELANTGTMYTAISPDSRYLVLDSVLPGGQGNTHPVWDLMTMKEVAELRLSDGEFGIDYRFANDGRLLTGTSKGVLAWDLATGEHEVLVEYAVGSSLRATMAGDCWCSMPEERGA